MAGGQWAVYRFGAFELDAADRSLKRDGRPVTLTPKLFDLLMVLVTSAGRLVEKDVLFSRVWPDAVVQEASLTKSIFNLRRALAQDETSRYIETVSKRGYRFVIPVTESRVPLLLPRSAASHDVEDDSPERTRAGSIAVLPFTDLGAARDQQLFCDGMSEEIISALGHVPQLRVISYTSSRRYKGSDADAREIARELGVSWLLEGSIRQAQDTVRIAVRLVRAADGLMVWSGRFDRRLENVFAVQDEIAATIVQTLSEGWPRTPLRW